MPAVDYSLKVIKPNIGGGRVSGSGEKLTSSFDLVEEMHFLFLRVVKARDLACNNAGGTRYPFVEIKIGNYKGTTKYFESSKPNPEWNQVFTFEKVRIQSLSVEITMRKKESVNDEFIGKIAFKMSDIPTRVPPDSPLAPQWYKLEDKDMANGSSVGELMLALWFGTQADEVFPDAWHSDVAPVSGDSIMNTLSKVYISPRLWYLRVNIIEAQDLVLPSDRNRITDVYVKASLGDMKLRTKVSADKSLNPRWNEDLMFVAAEPFYDPLILTVLEKNNDDEISLGSCVIHLSKVYIRWRPEPVGAKWYNLGNVGVEVEELKFSSKLNMRISLDGGYHVFDEPVNFISDYRATFKGLWPPAIGVLELGIISASGLVPMKSRDGKETTDAYCVAKFGPKWVRTRTAVDSFSPKWNEQYTWEVYDPYTVLLIGIFYNCHLNGEKGPTPKDPSIGKLRIRLSTLSTNRIYAYSYPLIVLQPSGVKKMGEIQLALRFTCPSHTSLLATYARPLFPKMHYIHPLSVPQLDSLRQQAVSIVSQRLSRADPPLRKEVVECMLDAGHRLWSPRRAKANIQRLMEAIHLVTEARKLFDKIKKWNNPIANVLVIVLYSTVVFNPNLVMPTLLAYCFLIGIWRYCKRPRDPTHVDIKLSLADSTNADEWDEEFDTFPSSKQGDVLRMRYDRLRSIAGKVVVMVGELATQGERLNALWSWQDRVASAIFLAFCVTVGVIVLSGIVPPRCVLVLVGLYVMRPPRFGVDIPSAPENIFRRLPTKTDCML
ncbi:multiple C2 and transmembrane domain-containing protein 1-like [Hibiscus syriacus]|uniref:Multiple C2 and transmembrane domain-containing protein 1-like n=1 Tax=Hibiscus syriacus TaxID=106335 RepID=A0A6A3AG98_HIBSY|nr:FT-interacting protein 3-like [Hibiscus syriacus]KAE8702803.1 multiple C2 and transmembrane domain-containing protein 1-like [Hibiscus syriacus]